MSFSGLVIPADASKPVYRAEIGNGMTAQGVVGGYIELLQGPLGIAGYCNEDGKRLRLPLNERASMFFRLLNPLTAFAYEPIVGNVVLFDNSRSPLESSTEGDAPAWLDDRF